MYGNWFHVRAFVHVAVNIYVQNGGCIFFPRSKFSGSLYIWTLFLIDIVCNGQMSRLGLMR